jgi:hypothetical protein
MPSIFDIKPVPRLRSQAKRTNTMVADAEDKRKTPANDRNSREIRQRYVADANQTRRPPANVIDKYKSRKKSKVTEECPSMSSTQRPQQRSGGKWRPEYHENLEGNSLSTTSRVKSSDSSPTSTDTRQRETSNETNPSPVPERTPVSPPLESDGRRRDIDGEIIESPDPDNHEYLGEKATKKYPLFGMPRDKGKPQENHRPQKKRKKNVEQRVVHAEKVWTNSPPAGWKA